MTSIMLYTFMIMIPLMCKRININIMMKEQDELSQQQSQKGLSKLDIQRSRVACELTRFIYILCGFLGIAMLIDKCFHLRMLRESVSILLMAVQIYMISWDHFTQNKVLPSLSSLRSNKYLSAMLIFHLHTICGFSWNIFAYVLLAALIVWQQINRKNWVNKQDCAYLSFFTIGMASLTMLVLVSEGIINISWNTITKLIGALLFILQVCFTCLTFEELAKNFRLIKIPIFQIIISYTTINVPVSAYFIYLGETFVSAQAYCSIVKFYTTALFMLFALGTFYLEEFTVLFCRDPVHLYRCSRTTFKMYGDFKRRNRKQSQDMPDCVLCHKQPSNVWFYSCKCMPYCQDCYSKVKDRRYKKCPICKTNLYWPSVIEFEPWQWKDYQLKFRINCKIATNQYLIKRKLD